MFSPKFTEPWVPIDVEPDWGVNEVWKGGNVVIGSGWITIADIEKETNSKDCSWQLGSWNEADLKGISWSIKCECLDERCGELLPGVDNVGLGVTGAFGLPTLLETSLLGSERA